MTEDEKPPLPPLGTPRALQALDLGDDIDLVDGAACDIDDPDCVVPAPGVLDVGEPSADEADATA